jgi:hypothetical protein
LNAWKMMPIRSRRSTASSFSGSLVMSWPATRTAPASGRSSPDPHCSSVLLPDPDGPMTAVNVALVKATLTWRRAVTSVAPRP